MIEGQRVAVLEAEIARLRDSIRDVVMWSHVQDHGGYLNDGEDHSFESCGKAPCHAAHMHLAGYVARDGRWVKP